MSTRSPVRPNESVDVALRYDVAARLAEGREAVGRMQSYVSACQRRGFGAPELTGYDGKLIDCYFSEAGLDLHLLEADVTALTALADAAADALRLQRAQLIELPKAWRGIGAENATAFLRRHCDTANELVARLRAAAVGCAVLRDELWRLVDAKVAAALAVDDVVGGCRSSWLAAARAVNSGSDDPESVEIIDHQVIPYVQHHVRVVWTTAVRRAEDGFAAAFGSAIASADPGAGVPFARATDFGVIAPLANAAPPLTSQEPIEPLPSTVQPTASVVDQPDTSSVSPSSVGASESSVPRMGTPSAAELLDGALGQSGPLSQGPLADGLGVPAVPSLPTGGGLGGLGGVGGLLPRLVDAFGEPDAGARLAESLDEHPRPHDERIDPDDPEDSALDRAESDSDPADTQANSAARMADESAEPAEVAQPADDEAESPSNEVAADSPDREGSALSRRDVDDDRDREPSASTGPANPCDIAAEQLPQVGS